MDNNINKEQGEFCNELKRVASSLAYLINAKLNGTNAVEDVYQETLLSAWANRHTLKDKSLFKSWIFQIARNKCYDYYRKAYKKDELIGSQEEYINRLGKRGKIKDPQRCVLNNSIKKLKCKDREIINLFYYEGLTLAQISRKKQIPLGTAKRRLYDARNRLRMKVKERND